MILWILLALLGWIQLFPYLQHRRNYCPKHRLWKELVTQMQRYAVFISLAQGRQKSGQNSKLFSTFRALTICIFWFTLFRNWIHFLMPLRPSFIFSFSIWAAKAAMKISSILLNTPRILLLRVFFFQTFIFKTNSKLEFLYFVSSAELKSWST